MYQGPPRKKVSTVVRQTEGSMELDQIAVLLTAIGLAGGLIWLVIRLATKPLETVVANNTQAMTRVFATLDRHETELQEHGEAIAVLDERTTKPVRKRSA